MIPLYRLLPLFLCFHLSAQFGIFSNFQYKRHFPDQEEWFLLPINGSDSVVTCMKYYYLSDDTLYFREYPSQHIHKINKADLKEIPFELGKDFHFSKQYRNINSFALKPKIMLGLSLASIAGLVIDLAQPNPVLINYPSAYALPLIFIVGYAHAKKMDRYINYYEMAEAQIFTKKETIEPVISANEAASQDSTQVNLNLQPHDTTTAFVAEREGQIDRNNLITTAGCQYSVTEFYFESDGNYYFSIAGKEGYYFISKDEILNLSELYDLGKDRNFTDQKGVVAKAKTGKVLGILYGVFGTITFGIISGSLGSSFSTGVTGGLGFGVLPATLIITKCNKTLDYYAIFNAAQKVTCN